MVLLKMKGKGRVGVATLLILKVMPLVRFPNSDSGEGGWVSNKKSSRLPFDNLAITTEEILDW